MKINFRLYALAFLVPAFASCSDVSPDITATDPLQARNVATPAPAPEPEVAESTVATDTTTARGGGSYGSGH